jgi:hypothetical protein
MARRRKWRGQHDQGSPSVVHRSQIFERHFDLRRRIGDQDEIALRAERRLVDRSERRHHDVAAGHPDAFGQARGEIGRREPLAAEMPGEIADPEEHETLAIHGTGHSIPADGPMRSGSGYRIHGLSSSRAPQSAPERLTLAHLLAGQWRNSGALSSSRRYVRDPRACRVRRDRFRKDCLHSI